MSRLSITECDANGNRLPSMALTGQLGGSTDRGAATNTGQSATTMNYKFAEYVNGDGCQDLAYGGGGDRSVRLGQTGGGFGRTN